MTVTTQSCTTGTSDDVAIAAIARTRGAFEAAESTMPAAEAEPTMIGITISVASQKTKHGRAAHLVNAELRAASTIAIQSG